jgi:type VI protein secretion system component VasF
MRRVWIACVGLVLTAMPALAQPAATDGFVPMASLPPGEEMPAARLVIAAYACFLVLMVGYVWTLWRRLDRVERELRELQDRQRRTVA